MAVRPGARGGGLTGLHYALISFVVLTVVFLGLFVFVLTRVQQAEERAERAERRAREFGTPPAYYREEATARRTNVFAAMDADLRAMAELVTGSADAVWPLVREDSRRVLAALAAQAPDAVDPAASLLAGLRRIGEALRQQRELTAALRSEVVELQQRNETLARSIKRTQDEFAAQVAELQRELEALRSEQAEALAARDEQLDRLRQGFQQQGEQWGREKVEFQQRVRDLDFQVQRLAARNRELQATVRQFQQIALDPHAILTKADGRVLRALPGSDVVYIDLGQRDRIRPGMGFEVFSRDTRSVEGLRGKASIEVVTVLETASECVIRRSVPGQPIVENDVVVNIAYERNRSPKFLVRGEFDLDYDGVVDYDGPQRVAGIIRAWGGQVVDELDETVDFVVIGVGPQVPVVGVGAPPSPVVQAQIEARALARSGFDALIEQARSLYIPVITQNQFLFLTGYAGGTPPVTP